ncbi:hypothetical protein EDC31_11174 [Acidomonas methanolica]|nr:hypothetical protein EDC31_11174 [Acidomonas methanolica]
MNSDRFMPRARPPDGTVERHSAASASAAFRTIGIMPRRRGQTPGLWPDFGDGGGLESRRGAWRVVPVQGACLSHLAGRRMTGFDPPPGERRVRPEDIRLRTAAIEDLSRPVLVVSRDRAAPDGKHSTLQLRFQAGSGRSGEGRRRRKDAAPERGARDRPSVNGDFTPRPLFWAAHESADRTMSVHRFPPHPVEWP